MSNCTTDCTSVFVYATFYLRYPIFHIFTCSAIGTFFIFLLNLISYLNHCGDRKQLIAAHVQFLYIFFFSAWPLFAVLFCIRINKSPITQFAIAETAFREMNVPLGYIQLRRTNHRNGCVSLCEWVYMSKQDLIRHQLKRWRCTRNHLLYAHNSTARTAATRFYYVSFNSNYAIWISNLQKEQKKTK